MGRDCRFGETDSSHGFLKSEKSIHFSRRHGTQGSCFDCLQVFDSLPRGLCFSASAQATPTLDLRLSPLWEELVGPQGLTDCIHQLKFVPRILRTAKVCVSLILLLL
jgi:hypothetical protein